MGKLWQGRFTKELNEAADKFNRSLPFDKKLYKQDIFGSMAHAEMLFNKGIISKKDFEDIVGGLQSIYEDITNGTLKFDDESEDIHSFVENVLTKRVGDAGKKLHTARSRNDQVATDLKLYVKEAAISLQVSIRHFVKTLKDKAVSVKDYVMPGYTHMQHAQPITYAHYLLAYAQMFMRDYSRIHDALERMDYCPLGAAALAGTTYDIDRKYTATKLGFKGATLNSLDSVSDRDYCVEILSCCSLIMAHLSKMAEEYVLFTTTEFSFIELDDAFSTGSSIMPQKKNADIAELVRGKTGRVYGDLISMLTVLKGLPLAYNKDLQEDKECLFDALETVENSVKLFDAMTDSAVPNKDAMLKSALKGFMNATDVADYLTVKGMPFRSAYKLVGEIVAFCIAKETTLNDLSLSEYKKFSNLFENDLYDEISIENCVNRRKSFGGTATDNLTAQIQFIDEFLLKTKK